MKTKEKINYILKYFQTHFPLASTELNYNKPYELVVAVILSAQCTDKRVNMLTPTFFQKYPDFNSLANGSIEQIYQLIKSCSYPNNKSKHLFNLAQTIIKDYNNVLPNNIEDLVKLPGIGRKSANVILSILFDIPAIAVDTHVFRVSKRLELVVDSKNPNNCEMQLLSVIPKKYLSMAHHWLILHGRYTCTARKPKCSICPFKEICNYDENIFKTSIHPS